MKDLLLFLSLVFIFSLSSCEKEDIRRPSNSEAPLVSQFIYDGMSAFYYWNDEMISKKPTANNTDAEKYFESLLSNTDTKNGWSWITDDVDALLADFSGNSFSFGYDLGFSIIDNKVFGFIKYVHSNTPAEKAGLQRCDLIGELNGYPITTETRNGETYVSDKDVNLLYVK